jgi:hypothetical protein
MSSVTSSNYVNANYVTDFQAPDRYTQTMSRYHESELTHAAALRYELGNQDDHTFEFVQGVLPVGKPEGMSSLNGTSNHLRSR